ncbi:ATP-dependent RNA helicase [Salix suchowensis]|nr:ATP-dependent RNA helicase [Salix suchowensis]
MESHQSLSRVFFDKANESVIRRCTNEVAELSLKVHDYHFNAKTMTEEQIRAYQVGEEVEKTSQLAPVLWQFLMSLLSSDEDISIRRIELARRRHEKRSGSRRKTEQSGDIEMSDDGGEEGGEGDGDDDDDDEDRYFEDSNDKPDDGIDQAMGRRQKLMKIVSTMLPLHLDVTQEDLDCSEELWQRCPPGKPSGIPWMNLAKIHAKPADDEGLLQRDRFNRWKFLYDLVHHGPEYFRQFKSDLGSAEVLKAVKPHQTFQDETSLMELLSQIRPQETGKLGSKPGFRRMHEAIEHVGIVLRLDCWRLLAVETNEGCKSLDDFADQKPEWKKLVEMATKLCRTQVAAPDIEETTRSADEEERDAQHENNLIRQQYFLLYEELSYGMNHGDIDRIESCFVPWIMIFAGCGKHKYAAELQRYLEDVHFCYPPGLK